MKLQVANHVINCYIVGGGILLAWPLQHLVLAPLNRFFHRRRWLKPEEHVFDHLKIPFILLFLLIALDLGVTQMEQFTTRAYIVVTAAILIRAVKIFKIVSYNRFDSSLEDNLVARKVRTQMEFVERTFSIIILFVGFSLILMTFEEVRNIGRSLIASAGIAGVVVGFAAQKSLGAFVSGFQVAFTQPIRIDDVVIVEGEWGTIEEITLTYVVVRIWDLRRLIVPINYFTERTFQNWTRTEASLLAYVLLNFDYSIDVDALRRKFTEFLATSRLWDKRVNVVQVTDATEKTVQVRFLMSAKNASHAFDLRCEIREKILRYVRETAPESLPVFRVRDEIKSLPTESRSTQEIDPRNSNPSSTPHPPPSP